MKTLNEAIRSELNKIGLSDAVEIRYNLNKAV